jgi:dephospho-CoA kinase
LRVAITGGIAEGKSTILEWLRQDGFLTASSDDIGRSLLADDEHVRRVAEIARLPLPLDRDALRSAILSDPIVRRAVNRYLHPFIRGLANASPAIFHEVPLLIEACLQGRYDRIWVVTCGIEEQKRRLARRYSDPSLAKAVLDLQLPTNVKTLFADKVIRTNDTLENVRTTLHTAVQDLFAGPIAGR